MIWLFTTHWTEKNSACQKKLTQSEIIIYVTCDDKCYKLSKDNTEEVDDLKTSQEEADTRMIFHAAHIGGLNYESIIFASIDTDVRFLCMAYCKQINSHLYQRCGSEARE